MRLDKTALAIALASAFVSVPAVYAVLRAGDVIFFPQANPAVVSAGVKIAMFWRLWIGVYLAPVFAAVIYEITRRDLARGARVLRIATIASASLIALQGIFLP
jgi:hypothetical protein